jgi:hypothetical protein
MTSSGGPVGGHSNYRVEEVCVHREVGSMSVYSRAAPPYKKPVVDMVVCGAGRPPTRYA